MSDQQGDQFRPGVLVAAVCAVSLLGLAILGRIADVLGGAAGLLRQAAAVFRRVYLDRVPTSPRPSAASQAPELDQVEIRPTKGAGTG